MENEIWKDVVGYEGLYQVSNLGRVRSLERTCASKNSALRKVPSYILKPSFGGGYLYYNLTKNATCRRVLAHRIVATAFIPNPNGFQIINHIDEDKKNNNALNLEWCNHKYNNDYGNRKKLVAETHKKNKKNCRAIYHIDKEGNIIGSYDSIASAACELGVKKDLIMNILRGATKVRRENLLFKYKEGTTWYNHKRV